MVHARSGILVIPTLSKNADPEPLRDKPPPGLIPIAAAPPPPLLEEKGAVEANDDVWEDDIGPTSCTCLGGFGAGSQSMSLVWMRVLLLSTLMERDSPSDESDAAGGALGAGVPEPPPQAVRKVRVRCGCGAQQR